MVGCFHDPSPKEEDEGLGGDIRGPERHVSMTPHPKERMKAGTSFAAPSESRTRFHDPHPRERMKVLR